MRTLPSVTAPTTGVRPVRDGQTPESPREWQSRRRSHFFFIIQPRWVSVSVTEPRQITDGLYKLRGTRMTLGISLGTGSNLPSRVPAGRAGHARNARRAGKTERVIMGKMDGKSGASARGATRGEGRAEFRNFQNLGLQVSNSYQSRLSRQSRPSRVYDGRSVTLMRAGHEQGRTW